ncbi:MAG: CGNR zinc finger domain-containing protein [Propionibacteriaceae bacterium]
MPLATVDLALVEQFVNTLDERAFSRHGHDHVATDELTSVEALNQWMETHGLGTAGQELHLPDLSAALSLRAALRASLIGGSDSAHLSQTLAAFPLRLAPDSSGQLHLAAATGVPGLDVIVETIATSVAEGRWKRLKLCASPDCRWAFYDTSRSGGGRWCSMEVCGNRHKTRAYRQRRAS